MIALLGLLVRAQRDRLAFVAVGLLQRILPFLLLPVFVRFMTPAEYGHVAILTSAFILASMVFGLGQEVVEYRYHFDDSARPVDGVGRIADPLDRTACLGLAGRGTLHALSGYPRRSTHAGCLRALVAGAVHATAWRFPAVYFRCQGQIGRHALLAQAF